MKQVLLFLLYLAMSLGGACLAALGFIIQGVYPTTVDLILVSMIVLCAATTIPLLFNPINIGFTKFTNNPLKSFLIVLGGMFAITVAGVLTKFFIPVIDNPADATLIELTGQAKNLFVFQACVLGPISEELMFRGLLFTGLRKLMPTWGALIISSAVFSAMHCTLLGFPLLFLMGAIMCYTYWKTGSLTNSIAIHMVNNIFASGF